MLRTAFSLIGGIIAAMATISVIEWIGHHVWHPPSEVDFANPVVARTLIESMPLASKIAVLAGWFVGTLVGATFAVRLAFAAWPGWVVTALVVAGSISNFVSIPHPLWMMVEGLILPIIAGWIATRFAVPVQRVGTGSAPE